MFFFVKFSPIGTGFIVNPVGKECFRPSELRKGGDITEQYVKIAILENEFEAQVLQQILQEREVEHYLKSFHDIAYDGLFQSSHGWGAIFAPKKYECEITEVIAEIRHQRPGGSFAD